MSLRASLVPLDATDRMVCTVATLPVSFFGERSPEIGSVLVTWAVSLSGTWISTEIRSVESESSEGSGTSTTALENSPRPPTTKHRNRVYLRRKFKMLEF